MKVSNPHSITIIVPIYNVEKYIKRCLDGIISQKNIGKLECILVDDCGQDNSVAIAESIIRDYDGPIEFRLIHHEKNGGLSAARNSGIKAAKGDYVLFVDSDDEIMDESIMHFQEILEKYPGVDVVQGNAYSTGERENTWIALDGKNLPNYTEERQWLSKAFLGNIPMTAWNKLIKKDLFQRYPKLFFMEGIIHEDMYLDFYLAKYAESFAKSDYKSYKYYVNPNTIMTSSSKEREYNSYNKLLLDFTANYTEEGKVYQKGFVSHILLEGAYALFADQPKMMVSLINAIKINSNLFERLLIRSWWILPNMVRKGNMVKRVLTGLYVRL